MRRWWSGVSSLGPGELELTSRRLPSDRHPPFGIHPSTALFRVPRVFDMAENELRCNNLRK